MIYLSTCPTCELLQEVEQDTRWTNCERCGLRYNINDDSEPQFDPDPDYGGAFDGFNVSSDADPGL